MEDPAVSVEPSEAVNSGGTMAAAADAVVEELMAMGATQVVNEADAKPDPKTDIETGPSLDLPCGLENDENFMPENHDAAAEGGDQNYPVRINMDKIRRLQSSLPVDDPLAPLGSTKNPIRIIQQGNQFITTQDLTDEQLKQILQVLRNQAMIIDGTETVTSTTNSVFNPETSTRIIFRVTNATKALARAQVEEAGMVYPDYRHRPRKRPRNDSDSSDPDFDPGVPEEELGPVEPRRKSRLVRPVRPPKHLVKDYKHIRTTEINNDIREEESDGGYSDFDPRAEEDENDASWMPDDHSDPENQKPEKALNWPCSLCGQVFRTKSGASRHQFMKHGVRTMKPKLDLSGKKGRELLPIASKKRNKLKQALAAASEEDILDLALPRLAKLVSSWDFLLTRSEQGSPALPSITKMLADYMNLHDVFRSFVADHLQPCNISEEVEDPDAEEQPIYVKIDNEEHSQLLHLPCGEYRVKTRLNEAFLPNNYKNVMAMMDLQRERQRRIALLIEQQQQQQEQFQHQFQQMTQQPPQDQQQPEQQEQAENPLSPQPSLGIETLGAESLAALSTGPVIITEADLNAGRYLAVLNENGEATDLVLHATSSLLYHRPTGQQVLLLEDGSAATVVPADDVSAAAIESGAVSMDTLTFESALEGEPINTKAASPDALPETEQVPQPEPEPLPEAVPEAEPQPKPRDETKPVLEPEQPAAEPEPQSQMPRPVSSLEIEAPEEEGDAKQSADEVRTDVMTEEGRRKGDGRRRKRVRKAAALKFEDKEDAAITQRPQADREVEEAGPVAMDVTQLFPGVHVTDIDENTMLIDRGDGRKIQVDHGGHGVTLETFQNLLTLP